MTNSVPVLMYHSIAPQATPQFRRFAVDPGEFSAQMDYIKAEGYRTLTAGDFAAGLDAGDWQQQTVVLTFDDSYDDFYTTALPILRARDFTATLFVPTGYVGATARWLAPVGEAARPMLSWNGLADVAAEGIEVAAHSHTHPEMDLLRPGLLAGETSTPRRLLQDKLGADVRGFAYPFGYWGSRSRAAVAAAGFTYALAVDEQTAATTADRLAIPRLTVTAGLGVDGLAALLAASAPPEGRLVVDAKRLVWRAARRARRAGRT